MRLNWAVPILVAIGVLASPSSVLARPTLAADYACYSESELIQFTGGGYTPGGGVTLYFGANGWIWTYKFTADSAGALFAKIAAPKLSDFDASWPRFTAAVTTNDQATFGSAFEEAVATTEVTVSIWDVIVKPWATMGPARGRPKHRVTLRTYGWTSLGSTLYAHYLRAGRVQRTVKIGSLEPPCGDLTTTMREFPFRPVPAGRYRIVFDTTKTYSVKDVSRWYKTVVVARKDAVR